jgi:ribosomal-protein-alanine N-acetyltransferase
MAEGGTLSSSSARPGRGPTAGGDDRAALDGGIVIEAAGWRDYGDVRRLEKLCFPVDAWPFWDVLGVLTLPDVIRLKAVVAAGQLAGFIAVDVRPRRAVAWIATICVAPEFRRRGVASALINACESRLQIQRLRLSVRLSNHGARRLYLGLGFTEVERWPGYYHDGEDALVMEKGLN